MFAVLFLLPASAQGLATHHPEVPQSTIAAENGPGALWVNPANLAYDPDARYGVYFSQAPEQGPATMGATVGIEGLSLGVHNLLRPVPGDVASDWSVDYATSIALPERIAVGVLMSWNFIGGGGSNYFAYDFGASWRPLPWLGVGGTAQNVGDPDPSGSAIPRTGGGVALRPLGDAVVLGFDYSRLFEPDPLQPGVPLDHVEAVARIRPVEGLYLRAGTELAVDSDGLTLATIGGGLEVYLDGMGGGYTPSLDADSNVIHSGWVGTDEPGESLIRSGRAVPELALKRSPAYQPRGGLFADETPSWLETLELIRRTEEDGSAKGLVLRIDGVGMSYARYRELRQRILTLEAKGKPVLVYLDATAGNGSYYAASAASKVVMHPAGDLGLTGIGAELMHMRGLFDIVGVEPQFVRRGKYKSAVETFTAVEPSEAALEMNNALLDDLFAELVDGIAAGRGVEPDEVKQWVNQGPYPASEAESLGIIDALAYPDELDRLLAELHDGKVERPNLLETPQPHSPWEDPAQIAVIYVEGGITSGESSRGGLLSGRSTGSDTVVRQLKEARTDAQVKAIVMRVDSPGGSAFASDEIWHAVERLKKADKPVIVSMGGVAASGGYYVSANADWILAEPNTITGSIGVYSGKFSQAEVREKLGISSVPLRRGQHAGIDSPSRPWTESERSRMQAGVDAVYDQFKQRVADGRDLSLEEVEEVAQGRVWSGTDALEQGLVDELGGLQDAIAKAKQEAKIPEKRKVGLVSYSARGGVFESLAPSIAIAVARPIAKTIENPLDGPLAQRISATLDPMDWMMVMALEPEGTPLLMDPWHLEVQAR